MQPIETIYHTGIMSIDEVEVLKKSFHPIAEGVILLDPVQFTILYTNPKLERILGYNSKELLGKDLDFIFPISSELYQISHILKDNKSLTKISWQLESKSKKVLDIDFSVQLIESEQSNNILAIIIYITDRTTTRNLERKVYYTKNILKAISEIKKEIFLNQEVKSIIKISCKALQKARDYDIAWAIIKNPQAGGKEEFYFVGKKAEYNQYFSNLRSLFTRTPEVAPIYNIFQDPYTQMRFHSNLLATKHGEFYSCFSPEANIEAVCFQIAWNNYIYGAIELLYFGSYPFTEDDIYLIQELCTEIGFSIYNKENESIKKAAIQKIEYQGILLDTVDVPIVSIDQKGLIQFANKAAEIRLNYSLVEMLPLNVKFILGFTDATVSYIQTNSVKREMIVKNDRTGDFPAMVHSSPILGKNKQFLGVMIAIFDITEQKVQELQSRNLDKLLIESAKFASIGELAAGIAHEINNPLQSALLYLEDLIHVDEEDPIERRKILKEIESANLRIKSLVSNLLDLGRKPSKEKEWSDPILLIDRAVQLVEVNSKKNNFTIEKKTIGRIPKIFVRDQEIEQVLINCLINSFNAISEMKIKPDQPKIIITIENSNYLNQNSIQITIEDNGPGISPSMIDKIFLPLFTTRREKHGTGLGLAISKKIISSHGGEIRFETTTQIGSCLKCNIPVYHE